MAVPAWSADTIPEPFMVATAVLPDVHEPPGALEESVVDESAQMAVVPEIVPASGRAITVTSVVATSVPQPLVAV